MLSVCPSTLLLLRLFNMDDMCVKPCCTLKADQATTGRGVVTFSYATPAVMVVEGGGGVVEDVVEDGDVMIVGPKSDLVAALSDGSAACQWFAQSGVFPVVASSTATTDIATAATAANATTAALLTQLRAMVRGLVPGRDVTHGATAETVFVNADGETRRVCLCALPTHCSRHNAPSQPHAITEFLRQKVRGSGGGGGGGGSGGGGGGGSGVEYVRGSVRGCSVRVSVSACL